MTDDSRPDPDRLLARIQAEDHQQKRGRLKIFLGYAAGVGKTYAMLEAGHQRVEEGMDVVVGYVETHGRAETEALLQGLEILSRHRIEYRGIILTEMDVDAVLKRRPQLAIVDELAHSNAPGSRHPKRYQDVEELLSAGINVYTTLNIQHLESLNDVINQITGITVRETIPDSVIDEATEIELIDLPPDELLNRLNEGKVYVPEQAARAIRKFFRKGNLTALRELTMRRAAERVDDQMRDYMQIQSIPGPWPATERLLVCISSHPLGERLVRATRRLADELNAEWFAVYIETPEHVHLSQGQRERIAKTLSLAEELGGRSLILPGYSVAETVMSYAQQHNVTKVVVGKSLQPRWREILSGSVVDQMIRRSGDIDIYVISSDTGLAANDKTVPGQPLQRLRRYLGAIILTLLATGLSAYLHTFLSPVNLVMVYLLAVIIAAAYLGRGAAILVSFLGVLAFDFFFVPPSLTLAISDTEYLLTFAGLFGVGLVISELTARVRDQAEAAQRREAETATLYALSRDLAVAEGLDEIIQAITTGVSQAFSRDVVIFLPDSAGNETLKPYTPNPKFIMDENELAVAVWAFQHGQPAGRGTDTLPASEAHYYPLKTAQGVVGVLAARPRDWTSHPSPDQRRLLETFASQAALAIERAQLTERAREAQLLKETEKLQTALLNSISHDLRTPLASVTGILSSLVEDREKLDQETFLSLITTAREEADRLNRLLGNLLSMTRIEAGAMRLSIEPGDIQDAIGSALKQVERYLEGRLVSVDLAEDLPLVPMDFVLIVQLLVNLLDNAIKYSQPLSSIEIRTCTTDDYLEVQVLDRGSGIPPEDLNLIFDKFFRTNQTRQAGGSGLGLSICKGIVEAHGGYIRAENRADGGAIVIFGLPLAQKMTPSPLPQGKSK